ARVLLDEKLCYFNINHREINGYEQEELSHMAVASHVARGEADVGIGIEKVALQVEKIDFIPLQKERCDLVIRKEDQEKPWFQAILSVLQSESFQNEISGIGGYDLEYTGRIIAET
ncbi:MAG: metal-binding protein, partial [Firmicutes bacterium]|nr:metal-binding protein [Bacillota bacterium]